MQTEALPGSDTRGGGGAATMTAMRELLQPHQGAFKQVYALSFEKMQFLIILLKCVVIVTPTDSPQQLIRHKVCQSVTVQCVSVPQITGRLRA